MPEYVPITYRSPDEEPPVDTILFKNAKIFDGKGDTLVDGDVLIEKNLITKVGPGLTAPEGKRTAVVDIAGKTLMPGYVIETVFAMLFP